MAYGKIQTVTSLGAVEWYVSKPRSVFMEGSTPTVSLLSDSILPDQAGHAKQALLTDGVNASWQPLDVGTF